jgi:hypothetical protein
MDTISGVTGYLLLDGVEQSVPSTVAIFLTYYVSPSEL